MSVSQIIMNGQMSGYGDMPVAAMGVAMKDRQTDRRSDSVWAGGVVVPGSCFQRFWKRF